MLVILPDRETALHLEAALKHHRLKWTKKGLPIPQALHELEQIAHDDARRSVTERHNESQGVTIPATVETALDDDREWLSRNDIHRLTGASLSTVDRWVRNGDLPSVKHGHLRRIHRDDLRRLLDAR